MLFFFMLFYFFLNTDGYSTLVDPFALIAAPVAQIYRAA